MNNLLERIQMLFFVVLLPWLISETLCYPVFGTKRYGRSTSTRSRRGGLEAYIQPPYYPEPIKYPPFATASEYDVEYYYPPEPSYNYPVSGPYARRYPLAANPSDKFAGAGGYQTLLPYVYAGRSPAVGYYGSADPTLPVDDGEERGDALPIGQEQWFEPQEALADANAAFLQNLILSQMYNDAASGGDVSRLHNAEILASPVVSEDPDLDWVYDNAAANAGYYADDYEDEDVKDLKSLVKNTNKNAKKGHGNDAEYQTTSRRVQQEGNNWYEKKKNLGSNVWEAYGKRNNEYYGKVIENPMNRNQHSRWADLPNQLTESFERKAKRADEEKRKRATADAADAEDAEDAMTTSAMPLTEAPTSTDFDSRRGQKEVPLLRPPTRHTVFVELAGDKLRPGDLASGSNPSVYETIKQLLSMEQGLRDETDEVRPAAMKKRFVSNEETLVDQLGLLNKSTT